MNKRKIYLKSILVSIKKNFLERKKIYLLYILLLQIGKSYIT